MILRIFPCVTKPMQVQTAARFTVFSEFEPMKSENTIKSRFEKSITSDFTDLTDAILQNKMAEEYVCSAAGEED